MFPVLQNGFRHPSLADLTQHKRLRPNQAVRERVDLGISTWTWQTLRRSRFSFQRVHPCSASGCFCFATKSSARHRHEEKTASPKAPLLGTAGCAERWVRHDNRNADVHFVFCLASGPDHWDAAYFEPPVVGASDLHLCPSVGQRALWSFFRPPSNDVCWR